MSGIKTKVLGLQRLDRFLLFIRPDSSLNAYGFLWQGFDRDDVLGHLATHLSSPNRRFSSLSFLLGVRVVLS